MAPINKAEATVIVVGRQAGSANAFLPILEAFQAEPIPWQLVLIGLGPAYEIWREQGWQPIYAPDFLAVRSLLDSLDDPIFLLTGTSLEAVDDGRFWHWAAQKNIPSLAFFDHWINYWQRFSTDVSGKTRFDQLPDTIAVIDSLAAQRLIEAGCPAGRVRLMGHPAFDAILAQMITAAQQVGGQMAGQVFPADDKLVLFISEPWTQVWGNQVYAQLGFTECTVLQQLLDALENIGQRQQTRFTVGIKLHPREDGTLYQNGLKSDHYNWVSWQISDGSRAQLIATADLVTGMTSMLLYEATLFRYPVVSLQPNRHQPSDLTDSRHHIVVITDPATIEPILLDALNKQKLRLDASGQDPPRQTVTERYISFIRSYATKTAG